MTEVERARRVVAEAYVERVASEETRARLRASKQRTAAYRAETADLRRAAQRRNGRKVVGVFLCVSILAVGTALMSSWYNYSHAGYCTRLAWTGVARGSASSATLLKEYCLSADGGRYLGARMASAALVNAVDNPELRRPRRKGR